MLTGPEQPPISGATPKQLLIFLHGVGADGNDLFGLAPMFAETFPDAYIASPNAPLAFDMAPFGYQWFSLRDYTMPAMLAGVQTAVPHLNAYIDAMLKKTNVPISKLAVIGFSQGTMTALYTLIRRVDSCGAIVGFSGALIGAEQLAVEAKAKPPVCLIHGEMDTVVPFGAMGMAETVLKNAGLSVESHARPGLPHGIDPEGIEIAKKFLKKHLG
ncbi:MAG: dienelactone hydrolase family protein [Rickettsiales bacterium]